MNYKAISLGIALALLTTSAGAATFGEITAVYADGSERSYVIRFLPDGRECIWSGPAYSNCSGWCDAKAAPPPSLPSCISLCGCGLQMCCPWDGALHNPEEPFLPFLEPFYREERAALIQQP